MNKRLMIFAVAIAVFASYALGVSAQGGIAIVPYSCGFESAAERSQWVFVNGSQPNKWFVDTATNNGGRYSLYISCDSGVSNTYDATLPSYTWAYRQIALTAGLYDISYDWKAQGYTNEHFMRAYLVPATRFNGAAGSSVGFQTMGYPSGWFPIDPSYPVGNILNQQSNWQNVAVGNLSVAATGTYYLVFGWTNFSSTTAFPPPAAVDNINIRTATCPFPLNLSVIATSSQGVVQVMWEEIGSASMWLLECSTNSSFSFPRTFFISTTNANYIAPTQQNPTLHGCCLAGLQPGASYYFRLRALCDTSVANGDTSFFSNVYSFAAPVSIGAQAERADVVLYPNPANDRFVVELNGTEADEICVLDIYGKQVRRIAATEGTQTIGLQGLAKGMYFVQVRKAGAAVATRKLVKK
ncbi:MAG: T9SS type A sorting domain-containing protein [Bacteroidales bacterium]|nr:T9SS type A sorting domain-containing protein [Bacteroidales bacterium]